MAERQFTLTENERFEDARRAKEAVRGSGGAGPTGPEMGDRIDKVELEVATLRGAMDWAKIVASIILGVMLAGFSLLAGLTFSASNRSDASASKLEAQIAGISAKIADEFRAQRQDQAAQISAIANAITATKQQAPQVILLPAPSAADTKAKQP